MTTQHPTGVFCASLTPLDEDLEPDHPAMVRHCHRLIEQGCDGIAMLGTTGEANSFSTAERMALLEAVIAGGIAPAQLLPGTGVCAIPETVALSRHAVQQGVAAVLVLPPFYYKGISEDGLFEAYARIIDGVGDDRLRVVLYHIPPMSQVPLPFGLIERLMTRYPGIVVGLKDSGGELDHMLSLARTFPNLGVLSGADPFMKPLLAEGGAGCITAAANLVSPDLATIFRHHADPGMAAAVERAQSHIVAFRTLATRYAPISSLKALMAHTTGETGWPRVRPPLRPLTAEQTAEVEAGYAELGAEAPAA